MNKWQPIETAPKGVNEVSFMRLAWPNGDDWSSADGFYFFGKYYAACVFYKMNSDKKYEMRECEVNPTHWMPTPDAPQGDDHAGN